jgi:hypothetical protein
MKHTLIAMMAAATQVLAQDTITVEGIVPKTVYADRASFRVVPQTGSEDDCFLDGRSISANDWVNVTEVNYHELFVRRITPGTGAENVLTVPFIVRSSERANSEWGLPPWTPYPVIQSASAEFDGVQLRVVCPTAFPRDLAIPMAAFLEDASGGQVRLNGVVQAVGFDDTPLILRRGIGSVVLRGIAQPGLATYNARLHSLSQPCPILIESNTVWTHVGGTAIGQVVWPADSRLFVTNDWIIPTNAAVELGAGTVVKLGSRINIRVAGKFTASASLTHPAVFTPAQPTAPWGGFVATNGSSVIELTGVLLTGSGGDANYFPAHPGISHRTEQPLFVVQQGARACLTNCYMMDLAGLAANGYWGHLTMDHCLVQRCQTVGEFEGGSVSIHNSALIEFPKDSPQFLDEDQDAIYLVQGTHAITDTLIGWAKDDAIDSGSGYAGSVMVSNCWIEACYHEGLAWSGGDRIGDTFNTVVLNCGQAIEAGYSLSTPSPMVYGEHLLCLNNAVGARYGDNYDWDYAGLLRLTNSFFLFNLRDVWGMNWDDWTYRNAQMDIQGGFLSQSNSWHPNNSLWDASRDGWRLAGFRPGPANRPVGLGIATYSAQTNLAQLAQGIPVGLSCFSTNLVAVDFTIDSPLGVLRTGTLSFLPGELVKRISSDGIDIASADLIQVVLSQPQAAEITTRSRMVFLKPQTPSAPPALHWLRSSGTLLLAWSSPACILEQSDQIDGPWQPHPKASSPVVLEMDSPARFLRLRKSP